MYMNKYPIYIISKGRYKRRPTANALEEMGVSYYIVVEQHEYEEYKSVVKGKVLILPQKYLDEYDTFWERAEDNKCGPGAARNFCWEHSIENGHKWHWVMDDNIESFERFNHNMKIKCTTPKPFMAVENFVDRYENLAIAGLGYSIFCPASEARPSIRFNTRIYSCLLIRNDIPYRWRGRYNEDTDLSLRVLKDGWCTVEFNAFLIGKRATQTMKGGNTDEFYAQEGTLNKSQILVDMHPDVAKLTKKFNRWHHHVDYKPFKKNLLIFKDEYVAKYGTNEFGMILIDKKERENER
jgi:hypothetical protein